eukprot:280360-Ditylum_brightwellii.AAC.1
MTNTSQAHGTQPDAEYEGQFVRDDDAQELIKDPDGSMPMVTTSDAGEKRKADDLVLTSSKLSKKE